MSVPLDTIDIAVSLRGRKPEVQVRHVPGSYHLSFRFALPWSPATTAGLLELIEDGVQASILSAAGLCDPPALDARKLGEELFQSLFGGDVERWMEGRFAGLSSGAEAAGGFRLRLSFDADLADVAALPWELLCHPRQRAFLSRSARTPVSRFLSVEGTVGELRVRPPLKVVLVGPVPRKMAALDLAAERDYLRRGLAAYPAVEILDVQPPTLDRLVEVLERDPEIHILHFMGHGGFEPDSGHGALLFEGPHGERHVVPGEVFAEQLSAACPSLRLVVLNCCQSGKVPRRRGQTPFTGVATALLWRGLPAVVAMQFAVSDQAALTFAGKFYSALAAGDAVDVATARARMAIYRHAPASLEWITPVLFLQVADGRVLTPEERPRPPARTEPAEDRRLWRLFPLSEVLSGKEEEILRAGADLNDPALQNGPCRLDLLAALVRLNGILELDRSSRGGRMPEPEANILDWVAFFTREIRIPRAGIVQYVLEVPSPEWVDPLKRATSLRLEAAWQKLRAVLLPAGLVAAAAPSEILLGKVQPPAAVFDRLCQLAEETGDAVPRLDHLGSSSPPSANLPLDVLLPLPGSAVVKEEVLTLQEGFIGFLRVEEEESGLVIYRRTITMEDREVVLDLEDLRPTRWYLWWLYSEKVEGPPRLVRLGRLRPLSPEGEPARDGLLALGLHNQLLRDLAPALEAGTATLEEKTLAHRLLFGAYEWVRREAPTCFLVDAYRNAAIWLEEQMFPGGPKP